MTDPIPAVSPPAGPPALAEGRTGARRRGRQLVLGLFLAFVVAYVLTCTYEIVGAAHGFYPGTATADDPASALPTSATAADTPASTTANAACAEGVRRLLASIDAAVVSAKTEGATDEATAVARFKERLAPEWADENAIRARCASVPRGQDAFAAVLRLRLAQEGFVRRQVAEITPIRRDVTAYLPR